MCTKAMQAERGIREDEGSLRLSGGASEAERVEEAHARSVARAHVGVQPSQAENPKSKVGAKRRALAPETQPPKGGMDDEVETATQRLWSVEGEDELAYRPPTEECDEGVAP